MLCRRFPLTPLVMCICLCVHATLGPSFSPADDLPKKVSERPKLIRLVTKEKTVVAGELIVEDEKAFQVWDIKTGQQVKVDKTTVAKTYRDVSPSAMIHTVGETRFAEWEKARLGIVLAGEIKARVPSTSAGKIAKVDVSVIYVTLGKESGVRKQQELTVFRGTDELKDPTTGEVLGVERRRIARLEVTEVRDRFCKAKLKGDLEIRLEVGDSVEPTNANNSVAILPLVNERGQETVGGKNLTEDLTTRLVGGNVNVVERSLLTKVMHELAIQQTQLFDIAKSQDVGKQVGAYAILSGVIITENQQATAQLRLVEVATGKILYAGRHLMDGSSDPVIGGLPVKPSVKGPNGHRYALIEKEVSWKEAMALCQKSGGYLVVVSSKQENDFIMELIQVARAKKGEGGGCWLGATKNRGRLQWHNLEAVSFVDVFDNRLRGDGALRTGLQDGRTVWATDSPDKKWWFICEWDK